MNKDKEIIMVDKEMSECIVEIKKNDYDYLKHFYNKYKKIEYIINYIDKFFYKNTCDIDFLSLAIKGIFEGLNDKNSSYLEESHLENCLDTNQERYVGIGIKVSRNEKKQIVIKEIVNKSIGNNKDVSVGDIIIKIDGVDCTKMSLAEINKCICGEDEKCTLTILREQLEKQVIIKKKAFNSGNILYSIINNRIGYIKINAFINGTGSEFVEIVEVLKEHSVVGIIIDIRDNSGGSIEESIEVADFFIEDGVIVTLIGGDYQEQVSATSEGEKIPIAILVNENSASAAELLASTIKDNRRGAIIGTKTFGKATIQAVVPLSKFDKTGIRLTVKEFLSPNGEYIDGVGVEPNILVRNDEDGKDKQLERAIECWGGKLFDK